jgi:hypothetical protein
MLQLFSNYYEVHLFISINDNFSEYYADAENKLKPWLKASRYENFVCPIENNIHPETLFQTINNKKVPYTVMSCFYNDMRAFELIEKYETENNIEYDIYCKFRADIKIIGRFNKFIVPDKNSNKLYSCVPPCQIRINNWIAAPICICDNFAYGNKKIMKIYCNTYNWIIDFNNKMNGNYRINYETSLTENIIDAYLLDKTIINNPDDIKNAYKNNPRGIEIEYFNNDYFYNPNRRSRDNVLR